MSTYTQILYQFIFSTKNREKCLSDNNRELLYRFIWGIFKNKGCHLYRIGGIEDHIHIVTHLSPSLAPANVIKDIKLASNSYIKENKLFQNFNGWQEGYGAFTYSFVQKDYLINYVKNQTEHHKKMNFKEEYIQLLNEFHIQFDEKYLF